MTEQYKSITCDGCGRQLTVDVSEFDFIDIVCKVCGYEHYCQIQDGEIVRQKMLRASTRTLASATNVYKHVMLGKETTNE